MIFFLANRANSKQTARVGREDRATSGDDSSAQPTRKQKMLAPGPLTGAGGFPFQSQSASGLSDKPTTRPPLTVMLARLPLFPFPLAAEITDNQHASAIAIATVLIAGIDLARLILNRTAPRQPTSPEPTPELPQLPEANKPKPRRYRRKRTP